MSTGTFDGDQRKPKGAVLFTGASLRNTKLSVMHTHTHTHTHTHGHMHTGPDGIGDFKVRVKEPSYIGHGCMSPEASSDTKYLYRAAEVRTRLYRCTNMEDT